MPHLCVSWKRVAGAYARFDGESRVTSLEDLASRGESTRRQVVELDHCDVDVCVNVTCQHCGCRCFWAAPGDLASLLSVVSTLRVTGVSVLHMELRAHCCGMKDSHTTREDGRGSVEWRNAQAVLL